jgi:arylsulfatase
MNAVVEIPEGGVTGPIAAMGGHTAGWSVYLNDSGVPTFAYNFPGPTYTYIRGTEPLTAGRHEVGYEFEKTGPEPLGAGGTGRISVDGEVVAEGEIARTCTVGYSLDETFDIGWDKGSPVCEEYGPIARFTGKIVKVDFDSRPDLHPDHDQYRADAEVTHALIRQ